MNHKNHTALITGANSGFGFETAALLAQQGYGHIILACRSIEKAQAARTILIERVGKDVFGILAIDVADINSSKHAAQELKQQLKKLESSIDLLVLNAGMASQTHERTAQGIEVTLAASLFGHHQLTMDLLAAGKLAPTARIVIAGSEATRGDVPGMKLFDYEIIKRHFDGDLNRSMDAVASGVQPNRYNMNSTYANAKLWVAWWAASLSRKLPTPMIVVAVSPGSAPDTGLSRHMPALMRWVMMPILKVIGPKFGMAGSVAQGAQRYVDAGEFSPEASGKFWASKPKVLVGAMEEQLYPHISDQQMQDATWRSVVRLTGADLPAQLAKV
jgi:NAD(P)-dependent dehydrogenase (short-subunit alcohol dehydrogenase family)